MAYKTIFDFLMAVELANAFTNVTVAVGSRNLNLILNFKSTAISSEKTARIRLGCRWFQMDAQSLNVETRNAERTRNCSFIMELPCHMTSIFLGVNKIQCLIRFEIS